jgi:hypothetical protein
MAHAFKTISAKPTFGTLQENLYQSDYINKKKGIITFCRSPSICHRLKVTPSYNSRYSFNIGRNSLILDRCNVLRVNKSNLIISQYTKEDLNGVCTVSPLSPYIPPAPCGPDNPCTPCQNNNVVIVDPLNSASPFYNEYIIDPLGQLFGKSQCGELNYTDYMIFTPSYIKNS